MIFNKIFKAFTGILLLSFIIVGGFLFPLLSNYVVSEKEDTLLKAGKSISKMSADLAVRNFEDYKDLYIASINIVGQNLNCEVILADTEGNIITKTVYKYTESPIEQISPDILKDVNEGNYAKKMGKLQNSSSETLTIGIPVYLNNKIIGGVYLTTDAPEIKKLREDIFEIYLYSVLVVLIISLIVIYFVSKNITQPINAITKASKAISSGAFETRVKIYKEDEIGELATAFNNMADSINKLEDMRRSFLSDVSHELKTPMTIITGFIEGVLDGTIPEDKRDMYLKITLDETKRLSKLVDDLLDISRLTSEKVKFEPSKFDINELIRLTVISFENKLNEKELTVNVVFENEIQQVIAEKDSIKRVLTNLLDNAVKFCNEKGQIDVKVTENTEKVTVSIKNEGQGISEEEKKIIFERFYKADKSRSQNKNGVGLGLYIVKNIINKHKQKIWVETKTGEYAEFCFTLEKSK